MLRFIADRLEPTKESYLGNETLCENIRGLNGNVGAT